MASNGGNHRDLEAGIPQRSRSDGSAGGDPFDIESIKRAPAEALKRWRKVALVLNASRRFRYTLDLKKEEQRLKLLTKIRSQSDIPPDTIPRALTPLSGRRELPGEELAGDETPAVTTKLEVAKLAGMQSSELALSILHQHGGVEGVAKQLKSDLEKGINDDQVDEQKRQYGPNTYPEKKGPGFWLVVVAIAAITVVISCCDHIDLPSSPSRPQGRYHYNLPCYINYIYNAIHARG